MLVDIRDRIRSGIQESRHVTVFTGTDTVGEVSDDIYEMFCSLPPEIQNDTCIVLTAAMSPAHHAVAKEASSAIHTSGVHTVVTDLEGHATTWAMQEHSIRKDGEYHSLPFTSQMRGARHESYLPKHLKGLNNCLFVIPDIHQDEAEIARDILNATKNGHADGKTLVLVGYGYFNFPMGDTIKTTIRDAINEGVIVKVASRTPAYTSIDSELVPYGPLAEIQSLGVTVLNKGARHLCKSRCLAN
jgi:hypothetical protein